jgi:hypothetical protein
MISVIGSAQALQGFTGSVRKEPLNLKPEADDAS